MSSSASASASASPVASSATAAAAAAAAAATPVSATKGPKGPKGARKKALTWGLSNNSIKLMNRSVNKSERKLRVGARTQDAFNADLLVHFRQLGTEAFEAASRDNCRMLSQKHALSAITAITGQTQALVVAPLQ